MVNGPAWLPYLYLLGGWHPYVVHELAMIVAIAVLMLLGLRSKIFICRDQWWLAVLFLSGMAPMLLWSFQDGAVNYWLRAVEIGTAVTAGFMILAFKLSPLRIAHSLGISAAALGATGSLLNISLDLNAYGIDGFIGTRSFHG